MDEMWPWSIQPIVRLTTSGQRVATDEARPQNQPVTFMKPTRALAAAAATAASVCSSTSVAFELHVCMFAPLASRQSTGFRCWWGESPTTVAPGLAEQQPRDQVAGEDEEDVDPDIAALQERHPAVVEHHEQDRDPLAALAVPGDAAPPHRPTECGRCQPVATSDLGA